jgi:hypothetical protein
MTIFLCHTEWAFAEDRMADDPKKKGKADRGKVAGGQKHEVAYTAKKTGAKPAEIRAAVKKAGSSRSAVEKAAKKK